MKFFSLGFLIFCSYLDTFAMQIFCFFFILLFWIWSVNICYNHCKLIKKLVNFLTWTFQLKIFNIFFWPNATGVFNSVWKVAFNDDLKQKSKSSTFNVKSEQVLISNEMHLTDMLIMFWIANRAWNKEKKECWLYASPEMQFRCRHLSLIRNNSVEETPVTGNCSRWL